MKDIEKTIKVMLATRKYTIVKLVNDYNERAGANYTRQAFSYKIKHSTLKLDEFIVICDILGFNLIVEAKDNHVRLSY